jgi:Flp pilus assembly protein TadD
VNIDQFAARELSPAEARKLAHEALEDPDLFDALVARGAVEASQNTPAVRAALATPGRGKRWAIALGAVAATWLLVALVWRVVVSQQFHQPPQQAHAIVPKPAVLSSPAVLPSLAASSNRPVLLASELGPVRSSDAPVFRGSDSATGRQPQSTGIITALDAGVATVNLGSLDGLVKGTELGPIVITTVFRDHARGKVTSAAIRVNDPVQVPPSIHLAAVLHQVDALAATGELSGARALARNALAAGSSAQTRALLERLAALDYQAGAVDAAREHYEAAANNFYAPPAASPSEQAATLNSLGALYLLRGDTQSAVKPLNQAASQTAIDPDLRAQILNNLGVLSEMNGDLATARDDYSRAHAQANLTRLRNLKHP